MATLLAIEAASLSRRETGRIGWLVNDAMRQVLSDPYFRITLRGHENWVLSVAFSPDGQTLASGSSDQTVRLWDLTNPAAEPVVLHGHQDFVTSVAFSPDGQVLASGGSDFGGFGSEETVLLRNLSNPGVEPVVLLGYDSGASSLAFSPDGQMLASGGDDQTVRLWIVLDGLLEMGCQKVRRNLTWDEWQRYLPGEPYRQTCPNLPVHPNVPEDEFP